MCTVVYTDMSTDVAPGAQTPTGPAEPATSRRERVYLTIRDELMSGHVSPYERLTEERLAERHGVSRTPVREALQRLERLGMVTMYPSRYTEVTPVTAETVAQSLVFAGHQGGIAARLAAPRITPAQREHVAELVAAMYASIDDSTKTSLTRWAVFSYLGEHCGNAQHRSLIADASMVLSRNLRGWAVPGADRFRMQQVYIDFRDAIRRGDGDAAERLAREMYYV